MTKSAREMKMAQAKTLVPLEHLTKKNNADKIRQLMGFDDIKKLTGHNKRSYAMWIPAQFASAVIAGKVCTRL